MRLCACRAARRCWPWRTSEVLAGCADHDRLEARGACSSDVEPGAQQVRDHGVAERVEVAPLRVVGVRSAARTAGAGRAREGGQGVDHLHALCLEQCGEPPLRPLQAAADLPQGGAPLRVAEHLDLPQLGDHQDHGRRIHAPRAAHELEQQPAGEREALAVAVADSGGVHRVVVRRALEVTLAVGLAVAHAVGVVGGCAPVAARQLGDRVEQRRVAHDRAVRVDHRVPRARVGNRHALQLERPVGADGEPWLRVLERSPTRVVVQVVAEEERQHDDVGPPACGLGVEHEDLLVRTPAGRREAQHLGAFAVEPRDEGLVIADAVAPRLRVAEDGDAALAGDALHGV